MKDDETIVGFGVAGKHYSLTLCGAMWECGPDCCGTELAVCDQPKGHDGDHGNTVRWPRIDATKDGENG